MLDDDDDDDDALARALARALDAVDERATLEHVRSLDVEREAWTTRGNDRRSNSTTTRRRAENALRAERGGIALTYDGVRAIARWCRRRAMEDGRPARGWRGMRADDEATAKAALCANGDHASAWSVRRRYCEGRGLLCVDARARGAEEKWFEEVVRPELAFVRFVQSRFPKAPSAWAHRRWLLARTMRFGVELGEDVYYSEIQACDAAIARKKSNYAAWSHRAWIIQLMGADSYAVQTALRASESLARRGVSDHGALHYRSRIIERYLELRPSDASKVFTRELEFVRELIDAFPGHETLWMHYRYAFAEAVKRNKSLASDADFLATTKRFCEKRRDITEASRVDPSWAEHAAASEYRLANALDVWTTLVVKRAQGGRVHVSRESPNEGFTVDSD